MNMLVLELTALVIVAVYLGMQLARGEDRKAFLLRLVIVAAAAWVTEETCIRWYGFYSYSPRWSVFIGEVPLTVAVIWPVVIDSARMLARNLTGDGSARIVAAVTAGLVFTDAALIEPVSVHVGLWAWTEPGLLGVPVIGVLGWALFTLVSVGVFEFNRQRGRGPGCSVQDLAAIPAAFVLTHLLLLAAWWGALRWVSGPINPWIAAGVAWGLSVTLAVAAARPAAAGRVPRRTLLLRVPAALFFFVLLGIYHEDAGPLVIWTIAFAPPYLVLTFRAMRG